MRMTMNEKNWIFFIQTSSDDDDDKITIGDESRIIKKQFFENQNSG